MRNLARSIVMAVTLVTFLAGFTASSASSASSLPHGITLSGLQTDLTGATAGSPGISGIPQISIQNMRAQIAAAAGSWSCSLLRLQVEQDKLVGQDGKTYSAPYMTDIKNMVSYARSLGLQVVINDQTEPASGFTANEPLPTYATKVFWKDINAVYKNTSVIYDLFNEPRGGNGWSSWRTAMQGALTYLRGLGSANVVWIEGIKMAGTLAGVPLLNGGPLVYTFHHPVGAASTATWNADFGYLANRGYQVVDGEWAGSVMPPAGYLAYLASHHIGLTSWTLTPGSLNSTSDYNSTSPSGAVLKSWWR